MAIHQPSQTLTSHIKVLPVTLKAFCATVMPHQRAFCNRQRGPRIDRYKGHVGFSETLTTSIAQICPPFAKLEMLMAECVGRTLTYPPYEPDQANRPSSILPVEETLLPFFWRLYF